MTYSPGDTIFLQGRNFPLYMRIESVDGTGAWWIPQNYTSIISENVECIVVAIADPLEKATPAMIILQNTIGWVWL